MSADGAELVVVVGRRGDLQEEVSLTVFTDAVLNRNGMRDRLAGGLLVLCRI